MDKIVECPLKLNFFGAFAKKETGEKNLAAALPFVFYFLCYHLADYLPKTPICMQINPN